ncbi:MAG: biopolymer transporter ExbD [Crocinitomicaceae bacterium]|nr:biopolymer transporter ExbD [Crocinitomicaceae bacterium]
MARRKVEEINAGSMADIAFLLLIFFLVTTTMEVDAGISRNLPLKRDLDPNYVPPKINDRNIFVIQANSNDGLRVEGEDMLIEDLEEAVRNFYLSNSRGALNANGEIDIDPKTPVYARVDKNICAQNINALKTQQASAPESQKSMYDADIQKWERKITTLEILGVSSYNEISDQSIIQLKNQAGTTYGLYIEIQDILKKVVNDLRNERCRELGWGEYAELDKEESGDLEKIEALQVLVPERIIEAKIEQ